MTQICFGQNFEDVVLWRALRGVAQGRYLDIGAQHPVMGSVSKSFYLAGWRGIHVEPNPEYAAALRADRPDEDVIEAAVGNGHGPLTFHAFSGTGLSTGDADIAALHIAAGHTAIATQVDQISLGSLLERFSGEDLHWLKIDVAGMEKDVLASWGETTVRPQIVVIDAVHSATMERTDRDWRDLIEKRGYHEVLFDGINCFFVADEQAELSAAIRAPANSLDDFAVPWHHWTAANAVQLFREEVAQANVAAQTAKADAERAQAVLDHAVAERDRAARERGYLATRLSDLQSDRAALALAVRELGDELASRRDEAKQLLAEVADANSRTQSVNRQLHASRMELTNSEQDRAATALHAAKLEAAIGERENALARLSAELDALRQKRLDLEQQVSAQAARIALAQNVATLAMQVLGSRYLLPFSAAHKRSRYLRKSLEGILDKWSSMPPQSFDFHESPHKHGNETMDLFDYDQRDPYLRADSLEELCRFSDIDFIRCAFVTILGRQPDPVGQEYYLQRLRSGDSMLAILAALRFSKEGANHDPGIAGLDKALKKHRNANKPLIGWLVRMVTGREGNSAVERQVRVIRNMLAVERNLSAARAATSNHMQVVLAHRLDGIERQMKTAFAGQAMTPRQIAQAEGGGDSAWQATLTLVLSGS